MRAKIGIEGEIKSEDQQLGLLAATKLNPGMPAEVIIVTDTHTVAEYLLEPISGVFRRALREKQ